MASNSKQLPGLAVACLCVLFSASAPEGAPSPGEVRKLVDAMRADSFQARDAAFGRLMELGLEFPDPVLAALPAEDRDPEVQDRCRTLRQRIPRERRRRELTALAGGNAELAAAAIECAERPSPNGTALIVQAAKGDKPRAARLVAEFLGSPDAEVRRSACWTLSGLAQPEGADRLAPLLDDPDAGVRMAAAAALSRNPENKPYAGRVAKLLADKDPGTRQSVLRALPGFKDPSVAPRIVGLLADDALQVRQAAVWALDQIASDEVAPAVAALLKDGNAETREAAAQVLGAIGGKAREASGEILKLLADENPAVRRAAAVAAAQLEGALVAGEIAALAADEDAGVRHAVAELLGELGDPAVAGTVAGVLKDPDPGVRVAAAQALAKLGQKPLAPKIADLLKDPDLEDKDRWAIVRVLEELKNPDTLPAILALLESPTPWLRSAGIQALGSFADPAHAARVASFLADAHPPTRKAAAEALGRIAGQEWPKNRKISVEDAAAWWETHKSDPEFARDKKR